MSGRKCRWLICIKILIHSRVFVGLFENFMHLIKARNVEHIRQKSTVISRMSIWFYYFEMLTNQHLSLPAHARKQAGKCLWCDTWWSHSGNLKDSSLLGWECNALSLRKQLQTHVRIAVPSEYWEIFTQWHRVTSQKTRILASGMFRGTGGWDKIVT